MKIASLSQLFEQTLDCLAFHLLVSKTKPPKHVLDRIKFFLFLIPPGDLQGKMEAVITYAQKLPPAGEAGEKRKPVQLRL